MSNKIYHIAVKVPDIDKAKAFYKDLFGFEELKQSKVRDHTSVPFGSTPVLTGVSRMIWSPCQAVSVCSEMLTVMYFRPGTVAGSTP